LKKPKALSSPPADRSSRAKPPAYVLDDQIGFVLRQAYQKNSLLFAGYFGADLTPTQWAAIAKLSETGGCSQNLLGRLTAMDGATIKGVVDRLTKRGLIESHPSSTDRRRVLITLTATGKKAYDQGVARALGVSGDTLAQLKPRERAVLLRLLKQLR
jgi:MarR family transcriptional regulator, lower aerobic nicotinate degradation pathway regulator